MQPEEARAVWMFYRKLPDADLFYWRWDEGDPCGKEKIWVMMTNKQIYNTFFDITGFKWPDGEDFKWWLII